MTGPVLSLGDALAYGLSGSVGNFTQLNNQYNQQAIQQQNTADDQQLRAQQAAEQQRQFDTQFKANRDTQTFQFLSGQQQQLIATLAKGGYTKDSAEYKAAQQALGEANKLMSRVIRGEQLSPEELGGYDTLMGNLGALLGTGAQTLGNRAAANADLTNQGLAGQVVGQDLQNDLTRQTTPYSVRQQAAQAGSMESKYAVDFATQDDQITESGAKARTAVSAADLSDFDMQYARDTLPKKIEGFNAQQDVTVLQRDILAAVAPFQTAAGKAQALKQIGASGGVAAGVIQGLLADGLLDPDTTAAARTLMGQADKQDLAATTTAVNGAEQSGLAVQLNQKQLDQVKATYDSTVALVNSSNDLGVQKNAVTKGLLQLDGAASRAKYLGEVAALGEIGVATINGLVKDGLIDQATADAATTKAQRVATAETTQLDVLVDQAGMTKNERTFSDQTLAARTDLFNSDSSLRVKTNAAELDLLGFKSAAQRGAYLQGLAKMGRAGTAILGNLVTSKVITQDQADAFKPMADNAQKLDDVTTESAAFNLSSAKQLFPIQLKSSQVALDSAAAQLAAFNEKRPFDLKLLKANVATLEQDLSQNGQLFGTKLGAAKAQLRQLQSAVRVAEGTEAASIAAPGLANQVTAFNLSSAQQLFPIQLASSQTALESADEQLAAFREGRPVNLAILKNNLATLNQDLSQNGQLFGSKLSQAQLAVKQLESQVRVMEGTEGSQISVALSQAASAGAAAQVDVATVGDLIRSRQLTVQSAQAQLNAQLSQNKFADATYANRVKAVDLSTQEGRLRLDQLQRDYARDPVKYALELRDLQARVAVSETDVKIKAASFLSADGSGVNDKKGMRDTLTRMQIGAAATARQSLSSYKLVVDKIFPNAKIAVNRYDPKNFSILTRARSDLTPQEQSELQAAAADLSTATGMQKDLITALGQNQTKGRLDPKLAQRLGIYDPGEGSSNDFTTKITPGADLTKLGFTKDALYNDKDAQGKPISYCVRFVRQYEEQKAGVPAFSLGAYFKGNATETLQAFAKQDALYVTNVTPKAALAQAGQLKEGDEIFLNYGNSAIDHLAVYDGKGGVIQHSLPGFRGQTIQGAVNTMSLEQFLGRAGKATVSFGRISGQTAAKGDAPVPAPSKATQTPPITAPPSTAAPSAPPSAAAPPSALPKLGNVQFDARDLGLMKNAVQAILGEKDPAKQLAKGTQIAGSLAAQFSTRYKTKITPASMTLWLQQNGRALQ